MNQFSGPICSSSNLFTVSTRSVVLLCVHTSATLAQHYCQSVVPVATHTLSHCTVTSPLSMGMSFLKKNKPCHPRPTRKFKKCGEVSWFSVSLSKPLLQAHTWSSHVRGFTGHHAIRHCIPVQYGLVIQGGGGGVIVVIILIISYYLYVHENPNNTLYVHSCRFKECLQNFCGRITVHLHEPLFMPLLPECSPHVHHSHCVFVHTFIFVTLIVIIVCWR